MNAKHYKNTFIFSLILWVYQINPAYAYLDPGTGSLLIQGLLGGIAGATVLIKIYWHKITTWLGLAKTKNDDIDN